MYSLPALCVIFYKKAVGFCDYWCPVVPFLKTFVSSRVKAPLHLVHFLLSSGVLAFIDSICVTLPSFQGPSQGPLDVKHGYWWPFCGFCHDQTCDLSVIGWSLEPIGSSHLLSQYISHLYLHITFTSHIFEELDHKSSATALFLLFTCFRKSWSQETLTLSVTLIVM